MNARKGFSQILVVITIVAALVLVAVAVYLFITRQVATSTSYMTPSSNLAPVADNTQTPVPAVKGAADLDIVSTDLDKTNVDSMNSQLDQTTSDSASF